VKVSVQKNKIIIEAEITGAVPSASGKTLVIASTRGNLKTDQVYNGQPVTVGLNVYIPNGQKAALPA
jgi:hypothetical protein